MTDIHQLNSKEIVLPRNERLAIDFATSLVLYGEDQPAAKYMLADGKIWPTKEPPCFLVVACNLEAREYASEPFNVHNFVLMDGSESLFRACTNSCLVAKLGVSHFPVGTTLVVHDYRVLRMRFSAKHDTEVVMIINNMSWRDGPVIKDQGCLAKESLVVFLENMTRAVMRESAVVFTLPYPNALRAGINRPCTEAQVQHGDWILEPTTRCDWQGFMREKENSREKSSCCSNMSCCECCECCISYYPFRLSCCGNETFPIELLNFKDIFFNTRHHTILCTGASNWEELSNGEKQWCLRWWYAVNIYKLTTRRGGYFMLPGCMTQRIQRAFPLRSNNGSFN